MSKAKKLSLARRRWAFAAAEHLAAHFGEAPLDIDEATDILAALLPDTRAEIQAEVDSWEEAEPNPELPGVCRALRDAMGMPDGPILPVLKAASVTIVALRDVLSLIDAMGERAQHIHAAEDAMIRELCEQIGYGAVMDSAARQWFLKDNVGCHTVGPCAVTVRKALGKPEPKEAQRPKELTHPR